MDEDIRPLEEGETLGQRIRRIRNDRGMSLAKVVGSDFSRAFLNQVEMGKARPSIRLLRVIAERLGTEVEYLLEGHEAGISRELALEKGRVLLAQGEPHRAVLTLRAAVTSYDWPLGSDARVCQAEALLAMGRDEQALPILAQERRAIEAHSDTHRMERLRAVERGERWRFGGDAVKRHMQLADRAHRKGLEYDELEHYRAARVLLEAGGKATAPPEGHEASSLVEDGEATAPTES